MRKLGDLQLNLTNTKTVGAVHTHTHTRLSKDQILFKLNHKEKYLL